MAEERYSDEGTKRRSDEGSASARPSSLRRMGGEACPSVAPSLLAEQFETPEQQLETSTMAMWTFLATEILFFGALFVAYMVCRTRWPEDFRRGSEEMKLWIGGANTAVLLTSSLFVALAVRSASHGNNRRLFWWLGAALVLGVTFLVLKAIEYYLDIHEGLLPGHFQVIPPHQQHLPPSQQHPRPPQMELFMMFYFIMTGFHALHMLVGIGVLGTLAYLARRNYFSSAYYNPVEISGLYWHFVDIVWVFLYPALYLLHRA